MKALYFEEHGERDVLQYGDLPDLENKENHVLAMPNRPNFRLRRAYNKTQIENCSYNRHLQRSETL